MGMIYGIHDPLAAILRRNYIVLAYHSISSGNDPYAVSPGMFSVQMGMLADAGYRVVRLDEAVTMAAEGHANGKCAVVSFDDGFVDQREEAVPVLRRHGWPGTFFVVTGLAGGTDLWDTGKRPLLDWDDLRQLRDEGHCVGAHSHTHARLSTAGDAEMLEREIGLPARLLDGNLGPAPRCFAFPYGAGAFNPLVRRALGESGYLCAVITNGYFGNNRRTDPYLLKRIQIDRSVDEGRFAAVVSGRRDLGFGGEFLSSLPFGRGRR
jgi:peptidoglycan/xylan/chitin deacetylase (PgdA/CDA1 family)